MLSPSWKLEQLLTWHFSVPLGESSWTLLMPLGGHSAMYVVRSTSHASPFPRLPFYPLPRTRAQITQSPGSPSGNSLSVEENQPPQKSAFWPMVRSQAYVTIKIPWRTFDIDQSQNLAFFFFFFTIYMKFTFYLGCISECFLMNCLLLFRYSVMSKSLWPHGL